MTELERRPADALAAADLASRSLLRSTPRPPADIASRSFHHQDGGQHYSAATGTDEGGEDEQANNDGNGGSDAAGAFGQDTRCEKDPNDLSAAVTVDPRLATRVRISDVRLVKGHTFRNGKRILACEHKFSLTLRSADGHWPSGALRLDTYDDNNMRVRTVKLSPEPTSDPARRIVAQDVQTVSPITCAELVFEEASPAGDVRVDVSDSVDLDPRITAAGMRVDAVRLVRSYAADSDIHRYEFSATLFRTGRTWPEGTFLLTTYDRRGRAMSNEQAKHTSTVHGRKCTLSPRSPSDSFSVSEPIGRAELLFEPAEGTSPIDDGWGRVVTEADESAAAAAGVAVVSLVTECKAYAGGKDQMAFEVRGRVTSSDGSALTGELCAQITVFDDMDEVVTTETAELGSAKLPARSFAHTLTCYRRHDPALVKVEFYLG